MFPVIVCIAKKEHDYIEEFIKYHLAIGFSHIFIYDNEDIPTYASLLHKYSESITVFHLPGKHMNHMPIQYVALFHFTRNIMNSPTITHVLHIDIDEFVVLKKHANIGSFIREYIVGDCVGIGINWRLFGSSNLIEKSDEPATLRFTMCEKAGNVHIKTLFDKRYCVKYNTPHDITLRSGHIRNTEGSNIIGPFNHDIHFSVIQLNHYKSKTLPEFRSIRERGRADEHETVPENVDENFRQYDVNEVHDYTAKEFYTNVLSRETPTYNDATSPKISLDPESPMVPDVPLVPATPLAKTSVFTRNFASLENTTFLKSTNSGSLTIGYQIAYS